MNSGLGLSKMETHLFTSYRLDRHRICHNIPFRQRSFAHEEFILSLVRCRSISSKGIVNRIEKMRWISSKSKFILYIFWFGFVSASSFSISVYFLCVACFISWSFARGGFRLLFGRWLNAIGFIFFLRIFVAFEFVRDTVNRKESYANLGHQWATKQSNTYGRARVSLCVYIESSHIDEVMQTEAWNASLWCITNYAEQKFSFGPIRLFSVAAGCAIAVPASNGFFFRFSVSIRRLSKRFFFPQILSNHKRNFVAFSILFSLLFLCTLRSKDFLSTPTIQIQTRVSQFSFQPNFFVCIFISSSFFFCFFFSFSRFHTKNIDKWEAVENIDEMLFCGRQEGIFFIHSFYVFDWDKYGDDGDDGNDSLPAFNMMKFALRSTFHSEFSLMFFLSYFLMPNTNAQQSVNIIWIIIFDA